MRVTVHFKQLPGVQNCDCVRDDMRSPALRTFYACLLQALVERFVFHHLDSQAGTKRINPTVPGAVNPEGRLVHDFLAAAAGGDVRTLRSMVARSVDVNVQDYDKRTALHVAVTAGHIEVVRYLTSVGASAERKDRWDCTASECAQSLTAAEHSARDAIIALLAQHQQSANHTTASASGGH